MVRGPAQYKTPPVEHPVDVRLGQVGRLVGYGVAEIEDKLEVRSVWEVLEPLSEVRYAVFVHLRNDQGLVAQHDGVRGSSSATVTHCCWRV